MEARNNLTKIIFIKTAAILACVIPPLAATLSYFPLWMRRGDAYVLSGFALCLVIISLLPFYKQMTRLLRSPASYLIWLILFIFFFLLSKIADEMTVISFVGFVSNLIGAIIFKLAHRYGGKEAKHE